MPTMKPIHILKRTRGVAIIGLALTTTCLAPAAPQNPAVGELLGTLRSTNANASQAVAGLEAVRTTLTAQGHLSFVGAPPTHWFPSPATAPGQTENAGTRFLQRHAGAFGLTNRQMGLAHLRTARHRERSFVRFQQTYAGLPVVGAEIVMVMNAQQGVESVMCGIETDTRSLDDHRVSLVAKLTAAEAVERARAFYAAKGISEPLECTEPRQAIFAPSVLDQPGDLELVWEFEASTPNSAVLRDRVLVDADAGRIVYHFTKIHAALSRQVYDSNCTSSDPGTRVRVEGGGASGIADADDVYDYFGDTHAFYLAQVGRDSIDGQGMTLSGTVRYSPSAMNCAPPPGKAFWDGSRMHFGRGWVTDDVAAHELTHGVTDRTSGLSYANDSGAINEAFSDIWGEFVDLSNGRGTDTAAVRWRIGEDTVAGAFRDMKDPTVFNDPDRLGSSNYKPAVSDPTGANDYGGVHSNSGIINKLAYLLTDGDTFNGQTVRGMGLGPVADLFYYANLHLRSTANYFDLFTVLRQGATSLGWSKADQDNVFRACLAVEIGGVYVDPTGPCSTGIGIRRCRSNGLGPFQSLLDGLSATPTGEFLFVKAGKYNGPITLTKTMQIRSYDGPATLGR
jgi:Zn-dependent metalloprotease